jgi:hypothetical protein
VSIGDKLKNIFGAKDGKEPDMRQVVVFEGGKFKRYMVKNEKLSSKEAFKAVPEI